MPIWPAAPVRFSTMAAWPKTCLSRSATGRVAMSVEPPAGKGTIHRIGFDGHGCASARLVASDRKSATKTRRSNVWIAQLCTLASQRKRIPAKIPGADASSEPGCLPAVSEVTRLPRGELEGAGHQDDHTDRDRYGARQRRLLHLDRRQSDAQRKGGHSEHGPDEEVTHAHERCQPTEACLAWPT